MARLPGLLAGTGSGLRAALLLLCVCTAGAAARAEAPPLTDGDGQPIVKGNAERVIAIGGALTEIVYALGAQAVLVAVDTTSQYPADALKRLPNVGYMRALSAEGILSLRPTLVIADGDAGPPAALAQLKAAGVAMVRLRKEPTAAGVAYKIRAVARVLGRDAEGEALATTYSADMAALSAAIAKAETKPRVLFVLNASRGILAAGQETAADHIIALAGGVNATQGYTGYKPLAAESVIAGKPDVILGTAHGLRDSALEELLKRPDIAETPAGRGRRVIAMDALLLLGFGPRTPSAVHALARQLHPGLSLPPPKSGPAAQ